MNKRINKAPLCIMAVATLAMVGLITWATLVRTNTAAYEVFKAPEPPLAKACLPVSEGLNTYQPSEVENADFCAPGAAFIQSVTISNVDAWGFSQPWREKGTLSPMNDRLAFSRKTAKPTATELTIQTAQGVYQMVIAADAASSAQP